MAKDGPRSSSCPASCPPRLLGPPAPPTCPRWPRQYLGRQLWEVPTNGYGQSVGAGIAPFSVHLEMEMKDLLMAALGRRLAPWGVCTLETWAEEGILLPDLLQGLWVPTHSGPGRSHRPPVTVPPHHLGTVAGCEAGGTALMEQRNNHYSSCSVRGRRRKASISPCAGARLLHLHRILTGIHHSFLKKCGNFFLVHNPHTPRISEGGLWSSSS